jgi:flagellar biogenesis protein FliO
MRSGRLLHVPGLALVVLALAYGTALAEQSPRPATEKPTTEKPTTEKPTTEKPTAEKPTAEKPTTGRPSGDPRTTAIPVPTPSPGPPPVIDDSAATPPPSAYDRARGVETSLPEPPESVIGQLFKTVVALAAVCGLIYLLFRWGPAKMLLQVQAGSRGGKLVKVVERVAIDQRSSLLVVDISNERLLIGTGEGGMRVLARMDPNGSIVDIPLSQPSKSFRSLIDIVRPKPSNEDDHAPK